MGPEPVAAVEGEGARKSSNRRASGLAAAAARGCPVAATEAGADSNTALKLAKLSLELQN